MDWTPYDAALFDLDGVLTPTADVHMLAWAAMFTEFFDQHGVTPPYSDEDYFLHVDGRPRYDGVRAVLVSRGVALPEGLATDEPGVETVCGLGNAKNAMFNRILADEGVAPYPGSVRLVDELRARGTGVAVVSSSRNARGVLEAARIADRFAVVVDGAVARAEGLAGKPHPETFRRAAELLGATVARSVVIEDAVSGVAAGRAGGFGLVVGVDRGAGEQVLRDAGADVVVTDLAELVPS
ncbi:HAD family phosphatase [Actinotalea sp. Marseille-Q4924]|uniref:HAD family hydrolase n=1 Tax=Actinotalea sp. Marseille-Q4924 TaxID=2866571 RepID=UPI001CE47F19|nr:HAD-IA family hydrolase [Actinotalea sp. Marseille-Q4924]